MKSDKISDLISNMQPPCISIIIPIDPVNKRSNYELLKKSIRKAKTLLNAKAIGEDVKTHITLMLDRSITDIPEKAGNGLGIFLSATTDLIITFPFDVKPKVIVDDVFEMRDLRYLKQYAEPYYVLNLSKKGVQLCKGELDEFQEIQDGKFPLLYEDHFQYERAAIADSSSSRLKSFEKDKTEITEMRLKAVFRDADAMIKAYIAGGKKMLLAGSQRMISLYRSVTNHEHHIAGKISGSFNKNNFGKLKESAWQAFMRFKKNEIDTLVKGLDERNSGHLAEGLPEAWAAANKGKGLMLFVEKDLHHRAYSKDTDILALDPPKKPYTILPDAVDSLITTVESKNGHVLLTENDQLRAHGHLALVLRY